MAAAKSQTANIERVNAVGAHVAERHGGGHGAKLFESHGLGITKCPLMAQSGHARSPLFNEISVLDTMLRPDFRGDA